VLSFIRYIPFIKELFIKAAIVIDFLFWFLFNDVLQISNKKVIHVRSIDGKSQDLVVNPKTDMDLDSAVESDDALLTNTTSDQLLEKAVGSLCVTTDAHLPQISQSFSVLTITNERSYLSPHTPWSLGVAASKQRLWQWIADKFERRHHSALVNMVHNTFNDLKESGFPTEQVSHLIVSIERQLQEHLSSPIVANRINYPWMFKEDEDFPKPTITL